ncbi:MAG TPA: citrate/2-methylcitrate synthase [Leptospiraceae bacterium]|nr:citrate/2-methylcitrate synthase [Leptospiraceae bacterium]HMW03506.1 citrate/2-methylcitrate synthase [Leptospiraceae bacterium]HMX33469.1 citrate/2-methylcitrate synthase [Leptospiraceae bacterium]HMY29574.1 citrate/2-methylcitrate synthase [Leptospiraceae bacterium]HMZ62936.1 citrate/2-methylcitrate synthase [Leptospiraceae bacterium]
MSSYNNAELNLDGKKFPLNLITGTDGKQGIDIKDLYKNTGVITVDPGCFNTAIGESSVSRRDPDKGELSYRGYQVGDLAKNSTFVETSYLLIYGELPNKNQLQDYSNRLSKHSMIHEDMINLFDGFPGKAHPLAVLSTMVMALSSYYTDEYEESADRGVDYVTRLLSKIRTIAAFSYKRMIGQPFIYPIDKLPFCTNFLHMLFSVPSESYEVPKDQDKLLNQLWILYGDHEQNVAATTVQLVGSTKANLFASISAGISALWGSREGGQSVAAVELLENILNSGKDYKTYLSDSNVRAELSRSNFLGHEAYNVKSPRAIVAREIFREYFKTHHSPLVDLAFEVDEYISNEAYFQDKRLYPNLEFYSGILFHSIGIPKNMFTLMQAIGKLPGWLAHWRELRIRSNFKKARPRQIYIGNLNKTYIPVDDRK